MPKKETWSKLKITVLRKLDWGTFITITTVTITTITIIITIT